MSVPFHLIADADADRLPPRRQTAEDFFAEQLLADDPPEPSHPCPTCGRRVGRWRACPYCGPRRRRPVARAVPVAPPDDLPIAEAVDGPLAPDPDDGIPFGIPIGTLVAIPVDPPRRRRARRPRRPPARPSGVVPVFIGYGVMLAMLVVFGVAMVVAALSDGGITQEEQNWGLAGFEVFSALLILGTAAAVGRLPPHRFPAGVRVWAWLAGFPLLALLLAMNIGFFLVLRQLAGVKGELGPEFTPVTVLLMCVSPAVFEEWFFRHLALGALRRAAGLHAAVWLSAGMFAAAHLLNPVAIPYLFLLGACLGYLRVYSGSLALPVVLHFVHNAVVILANRAL
jgi:membrane protease YdiL (CAAX protease family)